MRRRIRKRPAATPGREHDYGRAAERDLAAKRADYFACGTLVVWDVDSLSEEVIESYKASAPDRP